MFDGWVRVGLQNDALGKAKLGTSYAEQVRRVRRIQEELSLAIATPDEPQAMMYLKGGG
jgi:uncharacterized protein (DUF849 family)